ncbi:MAG: hypothetical protein KJO36_12500 [Acidimicrobiia bacterium]|nr:hypothetical protein [Acidimicrobiia bacterium]MBT8250981.1 hypothetical protein [Acidimicrobiia bacterium]NNC43262.1 hypothetical protein [Acidimicrobiia bacterium]NND13131.1 hypothetical protein [Acidimicrobiia bacterium]NNL29147.1 hypothetical protein [Acidimicrobiia bacterium]
MTIDVDDVVEGSSDGSGGVVDSVAQPASPPIIARITSKLVAATGDGFVDRILLLALRSS